MTNTYFILDDKKANLFLFIDKNTFSISIESEELSKKEINDNFSIDYKLGTLLCISKDYIGKKVYIKYHRFLNERLWNKYHCDINNESKYELFLDTSYYDTWCVREKEDRNFNSLVSYHFADKEDASLFLSLLDKTIEGRV